MKNDQDIDTWYEDSKEVAFKSYIKAIDLHIGEAERQARFLAAMQKIHKEYDSKNQFLIRMNFIKKHIFIGLGWIFFPFVYAWQLLIKIIVQLWTLLTEQVAIFHTWYKYGPGLEKETEKYISATVSEMKQLPSKKAHAAITRPIVLSFKRPIRRLTNKLRIIYANMIVNAKVNIKFYREHTLKTLSTLIAGYLKFQTNLIKVIKKTIYIIKVILHAPTMLRRWLKSKLNPEDL